MNLTIGMAAYEDYDGVYFTIQALKLYHPAVLRDAEVVVVDNSPPNSLVSPHIEKLLNTSPTIGATQYIRAPQRRGTTQPRNLIFDKARGDVVLCVDSHVLLPPETLRRLVEWFDYSRSQDIVSGPLIYDNLTTHATHFDDYWRAEMWGIWGRAWQCLCGCNFTVHPVGPVEDQYCSYHKLEMGMECITFCHGCGLPFPSIPYKGFETELYKHDYLDLGATNNSHPFEIPGMGLGLFAVRRDSWLGFNRNFRGFGGEELYIHTKYRQAGRKALCLPFLKWNHRFGRPGHAPYMASQWNKVRNYVLGHLELNLPLDRVYNHFVADGTFPQEKWDYLLENPVTNCIEPNPGSGGLQGSITDKYADPLAVPITLAP